GGCQRGIGQQPQEVSDRFDHLVVQDQTTIFEAIARWVCSWNPFPSPPLIDAADRVAPDDVVSFVGRDQPEDREERLALGGTGTNVNFGTDLVAVLGECVEKFANGLS